MTRLEAYAKLIIEEGVHIQKGQPLLIVATIEASPFVRTCTEMAYAAGCREVTVSWSDPFITRQKYLFAEDDVFDSYPAWAAEMMNSAADANAARLSLTGADPEMLVGIDADRILRANKASGEALKRYRSLMMSNTFQWCVAGVPTRAWATKVFPELAPEAAIEKLWEAIFDSAHIPADGADDLSFWRNHLDTLKGRIAQLNAFNFKSLHYVNSYGTDLTLELPEGHKWEGGSDLNKHGVEYSANIPSEEVFTLPVRTSVNGTVAASKPLVIDGNIADHFKFTFENGKIVKVEAETGKDILEAAISVDEGASYIGEVSLVQYDSPISNSGILFFNTLYDENASCHLAFGAAYACIKDAANKTEDELRALGMNFSMTHEDFMVGTEDLSIIGTTHDGKEIPVFVNGNFAF